MAISTHWEERSPLFRWRLGRLCVQFLLTPSLSAETCAFTRRRLHRQDLPTMLSVGKEGSASELNKTTTSSLQTRQHSSRVPTQEERWVSCNRLPSTAMQRQGWRVVRGACKHSSIAFTSRIRTRSRFRLHPPFADPSYNRRHQHPARRTSQNTAAVLLMDSARLETQRRRTAVMQIQMHYDHGSAA